MNKIYYQALLAGAMSALIITPALSEESKPVKNESVLISEAATDMQNRDSSASQHMGGSESMNSSESMDSSEHMKRQQTQAQQEPGMNETSRSELYSMRPNDLLDKDVLNSNEENIGEISEIVSSREDGQIHVVISSGGFMGVGTSEYVVPLKDLSINEEKIYLRSATGKDLLRNEYLKDGYVIIKPEDRPISEFSAFEERQQ